MGVIMGQSKDSGLYDLWVKINNTSGYLSSFEVFADGVNSIIHQSNLDMLERLKEHAHNVHAGFGKCVPLEALKAEQERLNG